MAIQAKHQPTNTQQTTTSLTFKSNQTRRPRVLAPKDFLQPSKAPEWLEAEKNIPSVSNNYQITAGEKFKLLATYLSPSETGQPSFVFIQDLHHQMLKIPLSKICSSFLRSGPP